MFKTFPYRSAVATALLVVTAILLSCAPGEPEHHDHGVAEGNDARGDSHGGTVHLTDAELAEFDIAVDSAGPGIIRRQLDLTGEIRIDPDRLAHIVPRFPGIVRSVRKKTGDPVRAGEVLAIIESNESLSPYEVRSLIDGTIIEMHLTQGEVISDNSHDIVVADLSIVWADLNAYQKDLESLAVGQQARITAGGNVPPHSGDIVWISPTLSESGRTAIARVIVANPDGRWRPGLFVNAEVITSTVEVAVAVPKTALQRFEDRTVVFVKTAEGFVPRPVRLGLQNHGTVEIREGLAPGERYVSKNGFTLKAELEKGAFDGGHNH